MKDSILEKAYKNVKDSCYSDYKSATAGNSILNLSVLSLKFLNEKCKPIKLISHVPEKEYFSYKKDNVVSRPINKRFFIADSDDISVLWDQWNKDIVSPTKFAQLTYTIALAPCLAMEIFDRQNKKGPATYFECYIGHLFAKTLGINPTKKVRLPILDKKVLMTMDFLFEIEKKLKKIHLPVKMSSRERVVQAWAHQKILNTAYGNNAYRGILIIFSETKLDSRSLEVIEICVPEQWLIYQKLLAKMDRIYYFDIPDRYRVLTDQFSDIITIKQFGEFFKEKEEVLFS